MGLPDGKEIMTLAFFVLTQYRRMTDGRTDGRVAVAKTRASIASRGYKRKAAETSNLAETQQLRAVTSGAKLGSKGHSSRSLGTKMPTYCVLGICFSFRKFLGFRRNTKRVSVPCRLYRIPHD